MRFNAGVPDVFYVIEKYILSETLLLSFSCWNYERFCSEEILRGLYLHQRLLICTSIVTPDGELFSTLMLPYQKVKQWVWCHVEHCTSGNFNFYIHCSSVRQSISELWLCYYFFLVVAPKLLCLLFRFKIKTQASLLWCHIFWGLWSYCSIRPYTAIIICLKMHILLIDVTYCGIYACSTYKVPEIIYAFSKCPIRWGTYS